MSLPFFYISDLAPGSNAIVLDEPTSKHVVQVLRMQRGELLQLTDGKGRLITASVEDDHRKRCVVLPKDEVVAAHNREERIIAISPLKNSSRFEWFLEKSVELGITGIIPIICERTEKQHLRTDRLTQIMISAMLQSQQVWLPFIWEPLPFNGFMSNHQQKIPAGDFQKFIAHCAADEQKRLLSESVDIGNAVLLIGPEGDFSASEIALAKASAYIPVSLGKTRLRTETAGIAGAVWLCR